MARIRTIKPEFFTSEDIVNLSALARLLYIALWCEADREGRMAWKPKTFKMRYFPADSCSIEKLCDELLDANLVVQYGGYAFIPAFHAHQHINPREAASQLPEPEIDALPTRAPRVSDVQVGREGKGREGDTRVDADCQPDGFETVYKAYPKKVGKPAAQKAWKAAKIKADEIPAILADIENRSQSNDWLKNNGQFVPNPATYLNQRRWEDAGSTISTFQQQWAGAI